MPALVALTGKDVGVSCVHIRIGRVVLRGALLGGAAVGGVIALCCA